MCVARDYTNAEQSGAGGSHAESHILQHRDLPATAWLASAGFRTLRIKQE